MEKMQDNYKPVRLVYLASGEPLEPPLNDLHNKKQCFYIIAIVMGVL